MWHPLWSRILICNYWSRRFLNIMLIPRTRGGLVSSVQISVLFVIKVISAFQCLDGLVIIPFTTSLLCYTLLNSSNLPSFHWTLLNFAWFKQWVRHPKSVQINSMPTGWAMKLTLVSQSYISLHNVDSAQFKISSLMTCSWTRAHINRV